jgi:hypothetical protein
MHVMLLILSCIKLPRASVLTMYGAGVAVGTSASDIFIIKYLAINSSLV